MVAITPREPPPLAEPETGLKPVSVSGMVSVLGKETDIDTASWSAGSAPWQLVEVEGQNLTFQVAVPADFLLAEGDMISLRATWIQWHGDKPDQWILVARESEAVWRDGETLQGRVFIRSREKGHCHWCGLQLRNVSDWQVSEDGFFECQTCTAMKSILEGDEMGERLGALKRLLGQLVPTSSEQAPTGAHRALKKMEESLSHKRP
ncbi:MAG: hypothetical protein R3E82_11550 [Pseudomonadales bacterium]